MGSHLVVTVHLYDGRFHGMPEWPPAPARLFQALVAGAASGATLPDDVVKALEWLESLPPPTIWVPQCTTGSQVDLFVPNNDLDAEGGDPARVGEIRTKKLVQPRLLETEAMFMYAFELPSDAAPANDVLMLTDKLYQFGRGIDLAWAAADVIEELSSIVRDRKGQLYRPAKGGPSDVTLSCPTRGTLQSLIERYAANRQRLRLEGSGKQAKVLFSQPPKARFERVAYDAQPRRVVFELRRGNGESSLYPWSLRHTARLVEIVRDIARERLLSALPDGASIIERYLIGRKPDGRDAAPAADRIRIIPLPSRGHEQVDPAVRRVLVEVPGNCSLRFDDVLWALSGQPHFDSSTGEVIFLLVESVEKKALEQYLLPEGARLWRSVTGVVLPIMRRRIDPVHQREEAKSARERSQEEASAISSVHAAIRHARIDAQATHIRVQREPHDRRGENAEQFVEGTRFSRHQMWHVELTFNRPVRGALVLGDGRFLGLGLMAPVQEVQGVWAFRNASGPIPNADAEEIARALRRAVMARAQAVLGSRESLPQLISGHEPDGNPIRDRGHLAFQFEPYSQTLLVIAPHVLERRSVFQSERRVLMRLDEALDNFTELRAGTSGLLALSRVSFEGACPLLFEPARIWTSVTPYLVNRHAKAKEASQALIADIREECTRRGLPSPRSVEVLDARGISGKGLTGHVRIEFAVAISGPIFLGRSRYSGGGSFSGMSLVHSAQSDAVGNSRFF